jgi:hypothetical protein
MGRKDVGRNIMQSTRFLSKILNKQSYQKCRYIDQKVTKNNLATTKNRQITNDTKYKFQNITN